jgi:hypothetical protein
MSAGARSAERLFSLSRTPIIRPRVARRFVLRARPKLTLGARRAPARFRAMHRSDGWANLSGHNRWSMRSFVKRETPRGERLRCARSDASADADRHLSARLRLLVESAYRIRIQRRWRMPTLLHARLASRASASRSMGHLGDARTNLPQLLERETGGARAQRRVGRCRDIHTECH